MPPFGTRIPELEVSITPACSLACRSCGFFVPAQADPGDPVSGIESALDLWTRLGLTIGSLAILGGEPTLAPGHLERAVTAAAKAVVVESVELVTNGLHPRGVTPSALAGLSRIVLSAYSAGTELTDAWKRWLAVSAPWVELVVRRGQAWDPVAPDVALSGEVAQRAYDTCWYRKHCVTFERGRLFRCSRIAKLSMDEQGLDLDTVRRSEQVLQYLNDATAPPACASCTQMAGLPQVAAGEQPDDRLEHLETRALRWFSERPEKT